MKLENYRHYIQSEFETRRIRNPHYSLRAYARDLNVSPSRISEALSGKRGISADLAQKLIKSLGLKGIDAEIFLLSVEAEHSRSKKHKAQAQAKLKETLASVPEIPPKTFTIVDWITDALLKMNEREPVINHAERAADQLGVPQFMVTKSLRFLTRLGFISGAKNFKTYLKSRGQGRKLNVDYVQILEQAQKAYSGSVSDNHFQHEVLLLEKKDMEKAHRILQRAIGEIRKLETKSKSSKVVFIANQIFTVEHEREIK